MASRNFGHIGQGAAAAALIRCFPRRAGRGNSGKKRPRLPIGKPSPREERRLSSLCFHDRLPASVPVRILTGRSLKQILVQDGERLPRLGKHNLPPLFVPVVIDFGGLPLIPRDPSSIPPRPSQAPRRSSSFSRNAGPSKTKCSRLPVPPRSCRGASPSPDKPSGSPGHLSRGISTHPALLPSPPGNPQVCRG